MHRPAGETSDAPGVLLEVSRPNRIVFTNALTKGWQPQPPFMVAIFEFDDDGAGGSHYRAAARPWSADAMAEHAVMKFEAGWALSPANCSKWRGASLEFLAESLSTFVVPDSSRNPAGFAASQSK